MDIPLALRQARLRARLSQAELARRTGTSQATISAYERGRKQPSVETLDRLLAAAGARLTVVPGVEPLVRPSARQHARVARGFADVLALAEALPARPAPVLHFPRLPRRDAE